MPFEFKVKLNKMKYSLWFVVPKQVADYLDLKAGDTLAIEVMDHGMTVRKSSAAPEIALADSTGKEPLLTPNEASHDSKKLFRSKFK